MVFTRRLAQKTNLKFILSLSKPNFFKTLARPSLFIFERMKKAASQPALRYLAEKIGVSGEVELQRLQSWDGSCSKMGDCRVFSIGNRSSQVFPFLWSIGKAHHLCLPREDHLLISEFFISPTIIYHLFVVGFSRRPFNP